LSEVLARIRNDSVLSRPAGASKSGRGMARTLARRLRALPARFYVGAALSALLVGIAVNALVLQSKRHPAPFFAPSSARTSPTPSNAIPVPPALPPDVGREASLPALASPQPPARPAATPGSAARAADEIGNWLRDEAPPDDAHLVLAAQNALVKLGYAVKADGNEGAATHQALRDFARAHGLPLTTDITPRLVKLLETAARTQAR
jgi:hypothetical protein